MYQRRWSVVDREQPPRDFPGSLVRPPPCPIMYINGHTRRYWPPERRRGGAGTGGGGKNVPRPPRAKYHREFDWNWTSVEAAEDGNTTIAEYEIRIRRQSTAPRINRMNRSILTPFIRVEYYILFFTKRLSHSLCVHAPSPPLPEYLYRAINFLEKLCKKKKKNVYGKMRHYQKGLRPCISNLFARLENIKIHFFLRNPLYII